MSQKATRRSRRQASEASEEGQSKAPTPKPVEERASPVLGVLEEVTEEIRNEIISDELTNGKEIETEHVEEKVEQHEMGPGDRVNGHEVAEEEVKESPDVEMDVLVVADEPDPELVFEENSDRESGQGSPVLSRCKTRRSLTRNVPTPKTPKTYEDEEEALAAQEEEDPEQDLDLNATFETCSDNISTKAEAGGDSTRMELSSLDSNSFLQGAKNKSFGETLRHLSTRRTIRPISEDYRKRLLQINHKNDVESNYLARYSVERVNSVGLKRKNDGDEEDGSKRFKGNSPGYFARFTSPLASFRNKFSGDVVASSTPKLTGYKDEKCLLEQGGLNSKLCEVNDGSKRWCSIM